MAESRVETISYVRSELEKLGNDELSGQFEAALVAGNIMAFQERSKANYIRVVNEIRSLLKRLGRRPLKTAT